MHRGVHRIGVKRDPRPKQTNEFQRQTARHVEQQWQGRFAVLWSPWRGQFTAIPAVMCDHLEIRDETSLVRLGDWMSSINLAAAQSAPMGNLARGDFKRGLQPLDKQSRPVRL
jgi:hypothetical protein